MHSASAARWRIVAREISTTSIHPKLGTDVPLELTEFFIAG
jgi:hypothetical protein